MIFVKDTWSSERRKRRNSSLDVSVYRPYPTPPKKNTRGTFVWRFVKMIMYGNGKESDSFLGTVSATFRVFAEDDSLVQRSLQRGLIPYVMSYIMIKQMR